jgi:hypothetical protein
LHRCFEHYSETQQLVAAASFRIVALLLVAMLGVHAPRAAAHVHASGAVDPHWSEGYTLVVLDPGADLDTAREWIQSRGATVALLLPPRYLTAWIAPELDREIVGRAGIRSLHRQGDALPSITTDANDRVVQRFFARAARGELDRIDAEKPEDPTEPFTHRPDALPRPPISELDIAANLAAQGIVRKAGGASLASNSDFMTGTVSVTLFFVESDGSGSDDDLYDWTASHEDDVFDDAAAGLSWWTAQAKKYSGCWVTFRLQAYFATEDDRCAQWREPSLHPSTEYAQVVQQVLGNFGYTAGGHLARASAFNAAMRTQNQTDWAYSAFIAANPSGPRSFTDGYAAWAWMGGPYVSLLERSFSWSIKQVFTHETAHMFRACDEYYTPGYGGCTECTACFDTGVANGNCEECNPNAATCMMRSNAFALCDYTAGQIGWWRTPCTDHALPAPRLDAATPHELAQGIEADIALEGDFFAPGTEASFGPDITVLTQTVQSETRLQAHVRIGLAAAAGPRDVVVTGPDGRDDHLAGGLVVRATPRHYLATHGGNVFPFDRPEWAAVDLTAVLAACSPGDTLLLAGGSYAPIALHQTLVLQGGWADDFGVRAVVANPTIVHGAAGTPAITIDGAASHPVLDGLVLRGGVGQMMATPELGNLPAGGGILVIDASPTLRNCTLENNLAGSAGSPGAGGGGFFWHGAPRLENCEVRGNQAWRGAGLFFLNADATLTGNTIESNDAASGRGAGLAVLGGKIVPRRAIGSAPIPERRKAAACISKMRRARSFRISSATATRPRSAAAASPRRDIAAAHRQPDHTQYRRRARRWRARKRWELGPRIGRRGCEPSAVIGRRIGDRSVPRQDRQRDDRRERRRPGERYLLDRSNEPWIAAQLDPGQQRRGRSLGRNRCGAGSRLEPLLAERRLGSSGGAGCGSRPRRRAALRGCDGARLPAGA